MIEGDDWRFVKGDEWVPEDRNEPTRVFSHFFEWKGITWVAYHGKTHWSPEAVLTSCTFGQWRDWIIEKKAANK